MKKQILIGGLLLPRQLWQGAGASWSNQRLLFTEPATSWIETLPLGNGRLGMMVAGGVEEDKK